MIAQVVQTVSLNRNVTNVQNPLLKPASQVSRDRRSALVQFDITGKQPTLSPEGKEPERVPVSR